MVYCKDTIDQDREQSLLCCEHLLVYCWHLFQLQSLQSENTSLRRQVTTNIYQIPSGSDYPDPSNPSALKRRQSARASRPMSMYETGSGLKPYLPKGETPYPEEGIPTLQPFPPHVSKTCSLLSFAISSQCPLSMTFPRGLHSVCKPFSLLFKKCFSLLVCRRAVLWYIRDRIVKKHNSIHLYTSICIPFCPVFKYTKDHLHISHTFTVFYLSAACEVSCTSKELLVL